MSCHEHEFAGGICRYCGADETCDDCGDPTEGWESGLIGSFCLDCMAGTMRHGHAHVHDEPDDCKLVARRDDESRTFTCQNGWGRLFARGEA